MKIVLSPSKTKTITPATSNDGVVHTAVRDGQFQPHITQDIVKHVQSLRRCRAYDGRARLSARYGR